MDTNKQNELQDLKNHIFNLFLRPLKTKYDTRQPWLTPSALQPRTASPAAILGRRADQNGRIRNAKLSDLGTAVMCEKNFAASYAGITLMKTGVNSIGGKAGTQFHNEMERLSPETWLTPARENEAASKAKETGEWYTNRMFVKLASIGKLTNKEATGKSTGVWGQMDAFIREHGAIIEFKSEHETLPETVNPKALGQGALYAYGLGASIVKWVVWIYIPSDLTKFNPEDPTTYRVFIKPYDEVYPIAANIMRRATVVAHTVDTLGFDAALEQLTCYLDNCPVCDYMEQHPEAA